MENGIENVPPLDDAMSKDTPASVEDEYDEDFDDLTPEERAELEDEDDFDEDEDDEDDWTDSDLEDEEDFDEDEEEDE